MNRRATDSGTSSSTFPPNAAISFTPLEDTVRATLDWHRARPPAERDKLQAGLTLEAEAGLLAKRRN